MTSFWMLEYDDSMDWPSFLRPWEDRKKRSFIHRILFSNIAVYWLAVFTSLTALTLTVSWFTRRACSSGLYDSRESKVGKSTTQELHHQTGTIIIYNLITLTDPTVKVPEIHPVLECLCFFPTNSLEMLICLLPYDSRPSSTEIKDHGCLPGQTLWVSGPSAWECPPRLRTCMWVTDAGTAARWQCGWTCAPFWWPQAGSLKAAWCPARRQDCTKGESCKLLAHRRANQQLKMWS